MVEGITLSLLPVVDDSIESVAMHNGEMNISMAVDGSRMSVEDLVHYSDVIVRNMTAIVSLVSNVKC